jgi:hypothetical protein
MFYAAWLFFFFVGVCGSLRCCRVRVCKGV